MPVKKNYSKADTEAAINRADDKFFKQWRSVRSDVDADTFNSSAFGRDVGHSFRHVEGTAAPGKSTYGAETPGGPTKKITKAVCEVMKLGESVLWVHSTYPDFG